MEFEANRRRSDTFVIHVAVNDVGELAGRRRVAAQLVRSGKRKSERPACA